MIKTTVVVVRDAYVAMGRIFEEVKLGEEVTWDVARMLRKMKPIVRDFDSTQTKLYRDAGGQSTGQGVVLLGIDRRNGESDAQWSARKDEYRKVVNDLHESIERMLAKEVVIDLSPINTKDLPKERRNERGEKEEVLYRATDIANAWPFLVDDKEAQEKPKE